MKMFFFQKKKKKQEQKKIYIHIYKMIILFLLFEMIRTIVRCLTNQIPKPLAPRKPKAAIDFVSKECKR